MQAPSVRELPQPHCGKTGWPWTEESPQPGETMLAGGPWPRISIITPSFNQGRFIEETIRSVLLQGYPNLEYIIIDGGSTDNSVEIIRQYEPWLTFWVSEKDRGQSHAINKGLNRSRGEIFAYLNSDDIYLPGTINRIFRHFNIYDDVGVMYGDCRLINEESKTINRWRSRTFDLISELCINFIYQPTSFLSRGVLETIGYFDETLHYTMDIDYWYRAGNHFKFDYIPKELACFRITGENKTGGSPVKTIDERKRVINRYIYNCKDQFIKKNRRRILSWHHYHAGEQLYSNSEFWTAIREFLTGIQLDPISTKTLSAISAIVDAWVGTKTFPTVNRLFVSTPTR